MSVGRRDGDRRVRSSTTLELGGLFHDIGNGVPDGSSTEPGSPPPLRSSSYMEERPEIGDGSWRRSRSSRRLRRSSRPPRRWDGKGYPSGRAGENVSAPARIIFVSTPSSDDLRPRTARRCRRTNDPPARTGRNRNAGSTRRIRPRVRRPPTARSDTADTGPRSASLPGGRKRPARNRSTGTRQLRFCRRARRKKLPRGRSEVERHQLEATWPLHAEGDHDRARSGR